MRYFNTSGPCLPEMHYMIPPEDFTAGQVAELYGQHTTETGQEFTPGRSSGCSITPTDSHGW